MESFKVIQNPILKVILEGVYDEECILCKFHGKWPVLEAIWFHLCQDWKDGIKDTSEVKYKDEFDFDDSVSYLNLNRPQDFRSFPHLLGSEFGNEKARLHFPEPRDIDINMMPFRLTRGFKNSRLPGECKGYWDMIRMCTGFDNEQIGKVCYLTIQEGWVEKGECQRRQGIHTEAPGNVRFQDGNEETDCGKGGGMSEVEEDYDNYGAAGFSWGWGNSKAEKKFVIEGGIFMASNVDNSCRIWNCEITDNDVIGQHGDIEHLRNFLPDSYEDMHNGNMYWLTDRTPHESLPLEERTYRQYFRLVTSQVSLWFEDHSTKNPLGVVPDKNITRIVKGNMCEGETYFLPNQSIN